VNGSNTPCPDRDEIRDLARGLTTDASEYDTSLRSHVGGCTKCAGIYVKFVEIEQRLAYREPAQGLVQRLGGVVKRWFR